MFYNAARTLAAEVLESDLLSGAVYPDLGQIRDITAKVATACCRVAEEEGVATVAEPEEGWLSYLRESMWWPEYEQYV